MGQQPNSTMLVMPAREVWWRWPSWEVRVALKLTICRILGGLDNCCRAHLQTGSGWQVQLESSLLSRPSTPLRSTPCQVPIVVLWHDNFAWACDSSQRKMNQDLPFSIIQCHMSIVEPFVLTYKKVRTFESIQYFCYDEVTSCNLDLADGPCPSLAPWRQWWQCEWTRISHHINENYFDIV